MGSPLCVPGSMGCWLQYCWVRPEQQKARPKPGVFVVRILKNDRWGHRPNSSNRGSTVVANGFDRAAFHGLFAGGFFFGGRRLLHDVRITAVIPAGVILRRSFAAQVAVDALVVDEVLARDVLGIPICNVSHKSKSGVIYRPSKSQVQAAFSLFCSVLNKSCYDPTLSPVRTPSSSGLSDQCLHQPIDRMHTGFGRRLQPEGLQSLARLRSDAERPRRPRLPKCPRQVEALVEILNR